MAHANLYEMAWWCGLYNISHITCPMPYMVYGGGGRGHLPGHSGFSARSRQTKVHLVAPPRTNPKSQTHPPAKLFFLICFSCALGLFSVSYGKGSSKTRKCFCKKSMSMSKTFPKKIDKNFDVSFNSHR
jgi:hypothetical protein